MGVGCRYKYGLVKVYSVALYRRSAETAGQQPSDSNDPLSAFVNGAEIKGLLIKMYREVSAETMVEAINEALIPRLGAKVSKDQVLNGCSTICLTFTFRFPRTWSLSRQSFSITAISSWNQRQNCCLFMIM